MKVKDDSSANGCTSQTWIAKLAIFAKVFLLLPHRQIKSTVRL